MIGRYRRWKQQRAARRELRNLNALLWHLHHLTAVEMADLLALTHHVAVLVERDYGVDLWWPRHIVELYPSYPEKLCRAEREFVRGSRVNASHALQVWKYTLLGIKDRSFYISACELWNQLGRGAAVMQNYRGGYYVIDPNKVPNGLAVIW